MLSTPPDDGGALTVEATKATRRSHRTRKFSVASHVASDRGTVWSMSTVHRWLADNPILVAFTFLAACLGLGRLVVGNAGLSMANIAIAFVGGYGGWLIAQLVSAAYYCSPDRVEAHRAESRKIALDALSRAKAAIAAEPPHFRSSTSAASRNN